MKTIKVDNSFFKLIESGNEVFTIETPVVRGFRQAWLTQNAIDTTDIIEQYQYGRFQLWRWYTNGSGLKSKSPVTCIYCPYVSEDISDQITYVDKKTKKEIIAAVKSIDVERKDNIWIWKITLEKQRKKKHSYRHHSLTYWQIDTVVDFIQELNYKSVDLIIPSLYNWVKKNKISVEQFDILCTWYFK